MQGQENNKGQAKIENTGNTSELIAALGVTSEIIDRIIAWLETRRDKNINTTLSMLGRKVREWNQPYVDALKPDWYV